MKLVLEAKTTEEPTELTTSATPKPMTTDTSQPTTPNGVQTTLSGSTQKVSTVSSSTEHERSTPLSTTIYPPQSTFSPRTQLARAGRSNDTGAIAWGTVGAVGLVALGIFFIYKFIQRRRRNNYESDLERGSLGGENILMDQYVPKNANKSKEGINETSLSDPELDTQSTSPTNSHGAAITEETPLDSVSVEEISLASSSSPGSNPLYGSSRSPSPISFSFSTNSHGSENVPMVQARPEETPLNGMSVEDVSPASGPLPGSNPLYGSSRSPSPIRFSLSTNSHGGENVSMAQARPEETPLNSMSVEDVSPASGPLPGNSRSPSPAPS